MIDFLPPTQGQPANTSFPTSPLSTSPRYPKQHLSKTKIILLSSLIGFLVLAGFGYVAAMQGYIAIPFLTPKSDTLFDRMVNAIGDINNAQYSLRLGLVSQPRDANATPLFENLNLNTNLDTSVLGSGVGSTALGFFDPESLIKNFPSDVNINGGVTLYVEPDQGKDGNARVSIDGTYTAGDATFSLAAEARKIKGDVYGIITKFPAFPFFDVASLKDKWVHLDPASLDDYVPASFEENATTPETITTIKTVLGAALRQNLLTVDRQLPAETVAGTKTEHYLLAVHTDKLPDVYQAVINELKKANKPTAMFETGLANTKDPKTMELLNRLVSHSRYEIWIDRSSGMLRQSRWDLTVVPPDSLERLKNKQFVLSLQLTLDHINKRVGVDVPSPTIDLDEATRLLTGITKEEQQFEKQLSQLRTLQNALQMYHTRRLSYPDSLDALLTAMPVLQKECEDEQKQRANTNTITLGLPSSDCYYFPVYAKTPPKIIDVYTNKQYGYAKDDSDYTVTYELHFFDGTDDYQKKQYVDGTNTMTSKDLSLEAGTPVANTNVTKTILSNSSTNTVPETEPLTLNTNTSHSPDSDGDSLSDAQEASYGTNPKVKDSDGDGLGDYEEVMKYLTNPNKTDTDGDGYDDKTEVTGGYNPNGPGKATSDQLSQWESKPTLSGGPAITNVAVSQYSGSATVSFTTDKNADGIVNYGQTTGYGQFISNYPFVTTHTITIHVTPGLLYHYSIRSCTPNPDSHCTLTEDRTFTAQ